MSRKGGRRRAEGQLNRGQVITTYGPGSMVDLPEESILISGLHKWEPGRLIREPRLVKHLRKHLGIHDLSLREPPLDDEVDERTAPGIQAMIFPSWFVANVEETVTRNNRTYRTRPLFKITQVKAGKVTYKKKRVAVMPVRFVRACANGHLADIDWHYYFFGGAYKQHQHRQLWMDEGGSGNDLTEVFIRCDGHGDPISLGRAALPDSPVLGPCQGGLPWLNYDAREECDKPSMLLIRSASNAYFTKTLTTISLPEQETELGKLVNGEYSDLFQLVTSEEDVAGVFRLVPLANKFIRFGADTVWAEILRIRGQEPEEEKRSLKEEELLVLNAQPDEVGGERPDALDQDGAEPFLARNRDLSGVPPWLRSRLDRIVLVHRLTEVMVQVGFTRFKPDMPEINGEYERIKPPPLAPEGELKWLPAVENQGEGVFLGFKPKQIEAWKQRAGTKTRIAQLEKGFEAWKKRKQIDDKEFPDPAYYMLHSLSHLLITAVAMECGYSATAIKERIYAGPRGYGILLYTWTPSSEGTLGGLIEVARRIEISLQYALELGELCSNDPVCAYHQPENKQEERFLTGAACHGCLLISEPCCEHGNDLLDRALVIPTVDCNDAAFFNQEDL